MSFIASRLLKNRQKKGLIRLALAGLTALLLMGFGVVLYGYFLSKAPVPNTDYQSNATSSAALQPQTQENVIETKTSTYIAANDINGLRSYYQTLLAQTSDPAAQAGLHAEFAQALFAAYPDAYQADIRQAAAQAEALQPTAATADFLSLIEAYYGNAKQSAQYQVLYKNRLGDQSQAEKETE